VPDKYAIPGGVASIRRFSAAASIIRDLIDMLVRLCRRYPAHRLFRFLQLRIDFLLGAQRVSFPRAVLCLQLLSLKTRSDCRSNCTKAVFRGVTIEFARCLQQPGRIGVTDQAFGHALVQSPRSPIQCVIAAGGFPNENVEDLSNAALITAGPWNGAQHL